MNIQLDSSIEKFRPWKPEYRRVFDSTFAFDCETTLIDDERPWLTPEYVLGAACDGEHGFFVRREHVGLFFDAHEGVPFVMHHAPFDLAVIDLTAPEVSIYGWVERNLAWDTQLLHRLLVLGSEGDTAGGKEQSTLDHCARTYLRTELPKDVTDSQGNEVRLSYARWLNRDPRQIELVYLEYLAKDAVATFLVFEELQRRLKSLLNMSANAWGFVDGDWLVEQYQKWGPQTHHIQLRSAIVLSAITANGMHIDVERRDELLGQLEEDKEEQLTKLREHGFAPGAGSNKMLQEFLANLDRRQTGIALRRTATGKYETSAEALEPLAATEPFISAYLTYKEIEKLTQFFKKMGRPTVHPSFDVLKKTGRTSSFGELNAQNLPRDDRVRNCFIPSDGHVLIVADYSMIEMVTLAEACIAQFGLQSAMAKALNADEDLHKVIAACVTGKAVSEVTEDERQRAKAINFGKPGGMGDATLKESARKGYGVDLTDAEVAELSESWFNAFPEMRAFLNDETDLCLEVARFLNLTPNSHFEHTGSMKFSGHPENYGLESLPNRALGGMCLKAVKCAEPATRDGRPYEPAEIDYFWTHVSARASELPAEYHVAIRERRPSRELQRALMQRVEPRSVYTLTGRLRANATYCARHNTIFQGLAADGAKLALWKLWRDGYRIVNFVHDEVLIEVPADSDLTGHARRIEQLMVEAMQLVVPDVRVGVKYSAVQRWYKKASAVFDDDGCLKVWYPSGA